MTTPVIGLLGAPGSGKSFVARLFAQLGCAVIDADQLAREALAEEEVKQQLVAWWGPDVLDEQGQVDRRVVGRIVFANREALQQLEQLTHPRVKARRAALREKLMADPAVKAIVEDSPLLLETGLAEQCDVLVFVEADRETRLQRVAESRGWTEEDLDRREKNQASLDIKRRQANYMVNNHADRDEVLEQVRGVLSRILQPDEH